MLKRSAWFIVAVLCAHAQTPDARDVFEVASVTLSPPRDPGGIHIVGKVGGPGTTDPGQIRYLNLNLAGLINFAYAGEQIRQTIGADSLGDATFEVTAKLPPNTTEAQARRMLQNLLADRFALAVHREQRELPVVALVIAKGGPKLTQVVETETGPISGDLPKILEALPKNEHKVDADGYPALPPPGIKRRFDSNAGKFRLTMRAWTVDEFAQTLSVYLRDLVVDQTGLAGKYDFSIVWATKDGPSIYDSVKPLGLQLQPKKLPIAVLVVDHANKLPAEN